MKKFSLILFALLASFVCFAQEDDEQVQEEFDGSTLAQPVRKPLETPWEQVNIGEFAECIPFAHQRQADVMYYDVIWRRIDLRDKMNHPLYFPTETNGTWRSFGQVIFDAIDFENEDNPNALRMYTDEFCQIPLNKDELRASLANTIQSPIIDPETGEIIEYQEVVEKFEARNIVQYNIKEIWFFDKLTSKYYVRILEISPVVEVERATSSNNEEGGDEEGVGVMKNKRIIGYICYDELRPFLVKQEVFNVKNNAQRVSFDDVITFERKFASYIYAENNVYNRQISEYVANARDQMIESENITNRLRTWESDLWEF